MTALSELVQEANVQSWSSREIARRAEKNGHKLSYASASVYLGGRHGVPSEQVLAAFSDVLNIPRTAAGVPTGGGEPWAPPADSNCLDRRQRFTFEELIRSIVASETLGEDQDHDQQDAVRMGRDAQSDGVTPPARKRRPRQEDYGRAADASRPSLLEADDNRAAARGEESQDPEDWL